jgi:hypothetical protein
VTCWDPVRSLVEMRLCWGLELPGHSLSVVLSIRILLKPGTLYSYMAPGHSLMHHVYIGLVLSGGCSVLIAVRVAISFHFKGSLVSNYISHLSVQVP